MAAKLILSMDGVVIKEYPLIKERMTVGRKAHNDIVIDNLAVSGEHAAVVTIMHDSFLEDMGSTNGLEVNGVPTKKHFLQNNDLIEIGKHKLKYITDQITQTTSADFERTMVIRGMSPAPSGVARVNTMNVPAKPIQPVVGRMAENTGRFDFQSSVTPAKAIDSTIPPVDSKPAPQVSSSKIAMVQVLTGRNAGKELELVKNLTTLGKPGVQVAVLTRRPQGYFITHVEGESFPLVNGQTLTNQARQLSDHDIIELAGIKMEFYFKL
ncbi:MAG: FHA domain-containing protein [Gallionella sp.]